MRRHRRRDHDRLDALVREHVVERPRDACLRVAAGELLAELGCRVAQPRQLGELVEVPHEVLAPVAEADLGDLRHSFQTLPSTSWPFVALRKSTTRFARRTTSP